MSTRASTRNLTVFLFLILLYVFVVYVCHLQEIQLSEILSVDSNIDPLATDATRAPHCFEMKTRDMVYYVGQVEDEAETPDPDSGIGTVAGQAWAGVTRSALMPGCVTPTTSSAPGATTGKDSQVLFLLLPYTPPSPLHPVCSDARLCYSNDKQCPRGYDW